MIKKRIRKTTAEKHNSKTLTDFNVPVDDIITAFLEITKSATEDLSSLHKIFGIAICDLSRFPNINNAVSYTDYIKRRVKGYTDAVANPPSKRTAKPKTSC